ncbi:hypothetical protein GQX73_g10731 [Xylaria multiplex]|uniref:GH16 domain-containing protein n=1 Tax=Xylaria multiplex TaxID=323545 RepID=A0A7C8IJ36_9PEZI|nr:hypothetical protein GQX73_g10731 [Xylaria multiplex]
MAYSLSTHYAGQGLLDSFSFFTGEDPNHGFVKYQSREAALASNLVSIDKSNRVKLGVDSINTYSTSDNGRASVRITSNEDFTYGLFIADFAHMPSSTCGTWPAFWALNNEGDWPTGGEVDIIEGANTAQRNLFSAHTTSGCKSPGTGFTGIQGPIDCSETPENVGCNYAASTSDTTSYGDAFNAVGGGVYALEWDSQNIKIWHFPRTGIPDNIVRAPLVTPDPTAWGPPQALFGGSGCKADAHFFNMSLVINTNFCGDYAGNVWGVADQCNQLAPTCKEYVAKNPTSFMNTFWEINYIDVYKKRLPTESTLPSSFLNATTPSASVTGPSDTVSPSKTRTITLSVPTITQSISTANPTQTGGGLADPATINGWTLLGCFGSLAGYKSFSQIASFATMDNEACVASCAGRKYAGVSGQTCYCADVLGDATAVANDKCDIPCPGNAHEICGGVLSAGEAASSPFAALGISRTNATAPQRNLRLLGGLPSSARVDTLLPRAAPPPPTVLLTVYGNVDREVPSGAPGMGGAPQVPTATTSAVMMTSVVTVTFTTVCATDAAKLITLEYCATLTHPACGNCTATPAVPMTTFAQSCDACGPGGENSITLAVPKAVAAGTGAGPVVAIAVQTVVPVLAHNATSGNASFHNPGVSGGIPVVATSISTVNRTAAGFMETLGYGLILWFVVFGIGIVL